MSYEIFFAQMSLRAVGIGVGGIYSLNPRSAALSISSKTIWVGALCSYVYKDLVRVYLFCNIPKASFIWTLFAGSSNSIGMESKFGPYSIVEIGQRA